MIRPLRPDLALLLILAWTLATSPGAAGVDRGAAGGPARPAGEAHPPGPKLAIIRPIPPAIAAPTRRAGPPIKPRPDRPGPTV